MVSMFCSQVLFFSSLFLFLFLDFFYPFLSFILSYVIPFFVNIKAKENIMFSLNLKIWYLKVLNNTSANNINFFSGIFKIFKFGNLPYIYRSQEFLVNNSIAILILFHPTLIILFFYDV